jgi:ribosomal-protein-alanine N-acetyltransferase
MEWLKGLRSYCKEDLELIFRLDEICFEEEFRFDRESMREFAERPNAIIRIAENVSGEIVGFVIIHVEQVASESRAYVVTLDVAPEYRRKGLARRLMEEAQERVKAAGARWMQLHVFTGNRDAIRFYERLGYERIRVRRRYYGAPGLDAIVYVKELSST